MEYPNVKKALLELAYEVGAINRLEPETECVELISLLLVATLEQTEEAFLKTKTT